MKKNKFLSIIIMSIMLVCCMNTSVYASDTEFENKRISENMIILFEENISYGTRERIISDFESLSIKAVETRNIACTLFGHDLETGTTYTITHKARTTTPRCLQKEYDYEICSRCDYSNYVLVDQAYIVCCS